MLPQGAAHSNVPVSILTFSLRMIVCCFLCCFSGVRLWNCGWFLIRRCWRSIPARRHTLINSIETFGFGERCDFVIRWESLQCWRWKFTLALWDHREDKNIYHSWERSCLQTMLPMVMLRWASIPLIARQIPTLLWKISSNSVFRSKLWLHAGNYAAKWLVALQLPLATSNSP